MNKSALKIFIFLTIYFLIVAFFVLNFNLGYTVSMILYLFVPSFYFSLKNRILVKKTLFFSLAFSITAVFIFDYMGHVSNIWYVPSEMGIRILGAFPIEEILWSFLFFYFILIIYNAIFFKYQNTKIFTTNTKYLVYLLLISWSSFSFAFFVNKDWLIIDNFYILLVSTSMILPSILFMYFYPKYMEKIILYTLMFFILLLIYEYSALKTGQWFFNGQHYIGWIQFFDVRFPVEELLFLLFSASGTISFYEFFLIDKRKEIV